MVLELGQCNLSWYSGAFPGTLYPRCGVITDCQTGVRTKCLKNPHKNPKGGAARLPPPHYREGLSFAQGHRASSVYRIHCIAWSSGRQTAACEPRFADH